MAQVVALHGAGLDAQRVDAAHIAQQAAADVVEVVEFDPIVMRGGGAVAPRPAERNGGVVRVADFVVRNRVAAALANPHAHRRGINDANVVDVISGNHNPARRLRFARGDLGIADLHASRAEVRHFIAHHLVVLRAFVNLQRVLAQMNESALLDAAMAGADEFDGGRDVIGGLHVHIPFRRQRPIGMRESEAAQHDVVDELAGFLFAFQADQLGKKGSNELGLAHIFPRQGEVGERAASPVEEPLARARRERRRHSPPSSAHPCHRRIPGAAVESVAVLVAGSTALRAMRNSAHFSRPTTSTSPCSAQAA